LISKGILDLGSWGGLSDAQAHSFASYGPLLQKGFDNDQAPSKKNYL
jgi:hypothetical protein